MSEESLKGEKLVDRAQRACAEMLVQGDPQASERVYNMALQLRRGGNTSAVVDLLTATELLRLAESAQLPTVEELRERLSQ